MVPPNPAQIETTLNPIVRTDSSSASADCLPCRLWTGSSLVAIGGYVASNARRMTGRGNAVAIAITGAGESSILTKLIHL